MLCLLPFLGCARTVNSNSHKIDIKIGYGNVSCTKVVGQYDIEAPLNRFKLVDAAGHLIKESSYEKLCELDEDEAKMILVDGDVEKATFPLFDTLGLDDSEGVDLDNMAATLSRIGQLDYLNTRIDIQKPQAYKSGCRTPAMA